jgi:undecaprenyl-diphosphatase
MNIVDSIILGIVEGLTEFLPISSTGHLILTANLLGIEDSDFLKTFQIAIQLGAILSVVLLYFKSLWNIEAIKKLFVAFLPTAVIGLSLYKIIKEFLGNELLVIVSLFVGGIIIIIFELWHKEKETQEGQEEKTTMQQISYKQAFLVGIFQSIAIIPGVSRSGATIIGGLLLGMSRKNIVEFSFLLAVPTMCAATGFDLLNHGGSFSTDEWELLFVGFLVSFLVATLSMKFFLRFVRTHTFIPFGIYRIVAAGVFFWVLV